MHLASVRPAQNLTPTVTTSPKTLTIPSYGLRIFLRAITLIPPEPIKNSNDVAPLFDVYTLVFLVFFVTGRIIFFPMLLP